MTKKSRKEDTEGEKKERNLKKIFTRFTYFLIQFLLTLKNKSKMKNLTKIFMAVVALVAVSCATDPITDDLRIPGGSAGLTELTLSLEETKTQLGAETSGLYPLLWSAGDKISVNGVESTALAEEYDGEATAKFTVSTEAEVYNIAYPAAGEGKVLFAAEQVYTAGNIANNATTMYARCNAGEAAQLKHLTAILKFGVVGEATLTHAQISTIDRAPIAGEFAIDFEKGTVTPTDASESVINYSFGGGLQLSDEVQYIHVAVPAGTYDELYITLYDNANGVMYATITADSTKPITVGKLRTFKNNISYAATDKAIVIKNIDDLNAFAAVAAETTANVVLTNDIEVTEAWTPIEGYAGTVLGNGYAIKGLTAPLFGTTSASFKGLHLEGVNINETETPNVGAFARKVFATDTVKPTIEHCSASGKLTVNCTEFVSGTDVQGALAIGGFVGHIQGVDIKDCVNNVAIDVNQVQKNTEATTPLIYPSAAGFVGFVEAYKTVTSNLSNLTNNAVIDFYDASYTKKDFNGPVVPYVAGVAAFIADSNINCTIENITNKGAVKLGGWFGQGKTVSGNDVSYDDIDPCLGGVFGYVASKSCSNVHNYGAVTYNGGTEETPYGTFSHYIGGVAGMCSEGSQLSNLHNHAAVNIRDKYTRTAILHQAGVIAHTRANSSLTDSSNEGKITANSDPVTSGSAHRMRRIAGVVAFADGDVKRCENLKKGELACGGGVPAANFKEDVCFGGVVAYNKSKVIENCTNYANVQYAVNCSGGNAPRFSAGGVVGLTMQPCNTVTNYGKLTVYGQAKSWYVGGCVGDMSYEGDTTVGGYHNYGVVNFPEHIVTKDEVTTNWAVNSEVSFIGGCVGYTMGTINNATNYESATIEIGAATFVKDCYIGGAIGCVDKATGYAKIATNNAPINIVGTTFSTDSFFGGVLGRVANVEAKASNLTNEGDIAFDKVLYTAGAPHLGGVIGDIKGAVSDITNNGEINISGDPEELTDESYKTFASAVFFGGCVGRGRDGAAATITNATNTAPISIENIVFAAGAFRVGGITSHTTAAINTATNDGAITIGSTGKVTLKASTGFYVGGIAGQGEIKESTPTISSATNNGAITIGDGVVLGAAINIRLGGVAGQPVGNLTTVTNTGPIKIGTGSENPVLFTYYTLIGGIAGEFNSGTFTVDKAINTGSIDINIHHNSSSNANETAYGGLIGLKNRNMTIKNSHNSGNVTIGGKTDIKKQHLSVGGLCGIINGGSTTIENCYNEGTIKVEKDAKIGSASSKDLHSGCLAGWINTATTISQNGFRNVGNIEVYNKNNITRVCYVGGVVGNTGQKLQNAEVFCDIIAPGATKAGMIIGQSRGSQLAQNCKLGGRIAKALNEDSTPKFKTVWKSNSTGEVDPETGEVLDQDPDAPTGEIVPFWQVIYGGTWADANASNCDGCSYIGGITIE